MTTKMSLQTLAHIAVLHATAETCTVLTADGKAGTRSGTAEWQLCSCCCTREQQRAAYKSSSVAGLLHCLPGRNVQLIDCPDLTLVCNISSLREPNFGTSCCARSASSALIPATVIDTVCTGSSSVRVLCRQQVLWLCENTADLWAAALLLTLCC